MTTLKARHRTRPAPAALTTSPEERASLNAILAKITAANKARLRPTYTYTVEIRDNTGEVWRFKLEVASRYAAMTAAEKALEAVAPDRHASKFLTVARRPLPEWHRRAIADGMARSPHKLGRPKLPTQALAEQIHAARARLAAQGKPHGIKAIAKELGRGVSTVTRVLRETGGSNPVALSNQQMT
jgi:hypothetical protein